jgi:hypothetical protein
MKKIFYAIGLLTLICSCDLEVQPAPEYVPSSLKLATFENETAWEFLKRTGLSTAQDLTATKLNRFDSLIKAVEFVGLVDEFQKPTKNRTYLFLTNDAFAGTVAGKIIRDVTGKTGQGIIDCDKVRLKNLLSYHIIDKYVDQRDALPVFEQDYFFQTLIEGETGRISARRSDRYAITWNSSPLIPAGKRSVGTLAHNYVLKNGIAHHLSGYVAYKPF